MISRVMKSSQTAVRINRSNSSVSRIVEFHRFQHSGKIRNWIAYEMQNGNTTHVPNCAAEPDRERPALLLRFLRSAHPSPRTTLPTLPLYRPPLIARNQPLH